MLESLRHHRRRIVWLPLLLLSLSGLSFWAQGCLATLLPVGEPVHGEHTGHAGHGGMPCCQQPGACEKPDCLQPDCLGMQAAERQAQPALAETPAPPEPHLVAVLLADPPGDAGPPPIGRWLPPPAADPADHPAQRFHRLRV